MNRTLTLFAAILTLGTAPAARAGENGGRLNPRLLAMEDNTWLNLKPERTPKSRTYTGNCFGGGKFYYFGGGHFGYHKNDVELYDPATNVWTRVTEPELPEGEYSDWVRTASKRAAPSGAPYVGGHTYQYTSWDPVRKRFFLPYRQCGVWEFDPEKAKWENIFSVFADPKPSTPHDMGPGTMAGIHSAFEPGLGKPVTVITHRATGLYVFDYEKKEWVKHKPLPKGLGTELYSTYVDEWKAHLFANNGWKKGKTHFTRVDLVAGTSKLIESPEEMGKGGLCMALSYDRANNVVVVMPRVKKDSTVSVWTLDVETLKWTEMKPAGERPKGTNTGKWAPLWYDPDHNVHLFLNNASRGAKFQGGRTETWAYRYKRAPGQE